MRINTLSALTAFKAIETLLQTFVSSYSSFSSFINSCGTLLITLSASNPATTTNFAFGNIDFTISTCLCIMVDLPILIKGFGP